MNEAKEIWSVVSSVPLVEASSFGRVRLANDLLNSKNLRRSGSHKKGHIFSQKIKKSNAGYYQIRLTINSKRRSFFVSRLVCEAFHGKPANCKMQAAHKNGISTDNRPNNLYWATATENIKDRENHGRTMRGENHYAAKLKESDVLKIKALLLNGDSQVSIAKKFGVTNYAIFDIKRGKSWKNV